MSALQHPVDAVDRRPVTGPESKNSPLTVGPGAGTVPLSAAPGVTDLDGMILDVDLDTTAVHAKHASVAASTSAAVGLGPVQKSRVGSDIRPAATTNIPDLSFSGYKVLREDDNSLDLFGTRSSLPSPSQTDADCDCSGAGIDSKGVPTVLPDAKTVKNEAKSDGMIASTLNSSKLSATGSLPLLGEADRLRRASIGAAASEVGSQDSNGQDGPNSLFDEPMSDEFGLVVNGPIDSIDLGGSSTASRQPLFAKDDKLSDITPAWSELKTKAGKERKRLPLACIACRRKKIRCSGEKPACKHCLRSRTPCVYKVTTRKATPRTDYMAMLDKRLKRMEDRIIKIVPKTEQDAVAMSSSVVRAIVKPAIPGVSASATASRNGNGNGSGSAAAGVKSATKKRLADEAFGTELDHWARASSKGRPADALRPHNLLLQQESEENKLLREGADALPSHELQDHLAEVYFENIYGQAYHLLHKPSYMRKLKAGTLPPVLILSVCAVSARFSSHPKLESGPNFLRGEEWASHARDIVMRRYEWPNITILTCLLLLGLHEFGTCHGGRSWALGGQAIRMAFALQLHKDVEQDPQLITGAAPLSFTDREIRCRTMWACFLMDRFNSSGTERPTFVREETIKIQLPVSEKHFHLDMPGVTESLAGHPVTPPLAAAARDDDDLAPNAKENMGVAAYMIRSIAVWGRVINYLNQGGKELDPQPMWSVDSEYHKLAIQADEMLSTLPPALAFSSENLHVHDTDKMANQFLFLHIAIQQNILFLNRFAVSSPNSISQQDIPKTFVTKAGAKAFAAANRISELLKEAESYMVSAPFVGYCAFLSSTVHIFGIFSGNSTMEATSKRNLATNVKFLSKMKRYWGMFHFMAENLREQYRTCADAARQGTPAHENAAVASPIFQYGDWFDRYPYGVSNSDFVDPAAYLKKEKGDDAVLEQKPELHTVEQFFTNVGAPNTDGSVSGSTTANQTTTTGRSGGHNKRKSCSRKGGGSISSRSTDHQTLMADMHSSGTDVLHRQRQQQNAQVHNINRQASHTSMTGQTSGAAAGFIPMTMPQAGVGSSFMPPLSPITMSSFSHQQQQLAQLYPSDLLPLSLVQQTNSMMPELDRQLVFGAYGNLDQAGGGIGDQASIDGLDWNGSGSADQSTAQAAANGESGNGPTDGLDALGHSHDVSSAWFMPFNMDPPELGQEFGGMAGSLDHLASIFGSSVMASQSGGGGLHHD
ncbi:c6 zinc finger domain containing protein [Grosmannia clavigera kw1407]|uniref:C6 zinc finger domain containing protein n=1 Tax=Grosmannia clavigera (strain kw1407 / UAMH 11150) TaxID=655863 RepID=F0XAE0_GROCL|nr:c6 zinc finger domain containing protein [Grosmannia clavigera kw1407]EFX05688.1 c6 zinc finger domain containing protein [Grosmannia clavigera kw1407]